MTRLVDRNGNSFLNLSEQEQNTGEKWIDGKPIYKKTVNTGALSISNQKQVNHGISNIGSFRAIDPSNSYGVDGGVYFPLPKPDIDGRGVVGVYITTQYIGLNTASAAKAQSSYVTIRYTKG